MSGRRATPTQYLTALAAGLFAVLVVAGPALGQSASPTPVVELSLTVAPYGDVFIDGTLRARNATRASIWLPPGAYDVEVKNAWSKAERRRITVPPGGAAETVRLEPLPASLIVLTNVDAGVRVGGADVGRSWTSELAPLSVPLKGWRARAAEWVVVERDGYEPLCLRAHFEAGTTTVVEGELKPLPRRAEILPRSGSLARAKLPIDGPFTRGLVD